MSVVDSYFPKRGDEVEAWLKGHRDGVEKKSIGWWVLDDLIDEYRLRSDYGKSLTDDIEGLQ